MLRVEDAWTVLRDVPELAREASIYFSQSGEDIVLQVLLSTESEKGCFVDIGAYHPFRFSNTMLLYLQGWRGVNVDANPATIELFRAIRSEDVNIHALVGPQSEEIEYFLFREGAYNTTNPESVAILKSRTNAESQLMSSTKMRTVTPNELFSKHVGSRKFDFLNIDVEGLDEAILGAIDFAQYRPKIICVEMALETWSAEPMKSFFQGRGYEPVSHTIHSAFFRRKE